MSLAHDYFAHLSPLLESVRKGNAATLKEAGAVLGQTIASDGILHTFGSGHSGIIALEMIHRAGGLVPVSQIIDPGAGLAENVPGYGRKLVERYDAQFGLREGDCLLVISNSGKNASPLDIALYGKEKGLPVIGLTAMAMSTTMKSEHPSGQRLHEVCDLVFDNGGQAGDAVIPIPGQPVKAGPTSTLAGALLMNLWQLEAIDWLLTHGHEPPLLQSGNTPGGKERNDTWSARYGSRLSRPV